MIANFFQSLTDRGVDYLLINGQATVLYGAATFSEDIDLWIDPTPENRDRFTAALRDCRARFYKLTPELTVENLARGHGFHFLLPGGEATDVFLDVMGWLVGHWFGNRERNHGARILLWRFLGTIL